VKPVVLLALVPLTACAKGGGEDLGLRGRRAVQLAQLGRPDELVRALGMPGRELDRRLGAHRMTASSTVTVQAPGRAADQLEDSYRLDSDGAGALHLVRDSSRASGLEAVVVGGEAFVRPRYGRFVRRRPEGDELDRMRALVEGVGAGYLGLVERWLTVSDAGRGEVAGRAALRLKLGRASAPAPAAAESQPARRWRDTIQVRSLEGELALDAASGAPLSIDVRLEYGFERDGQPIAVTLAYRQETGAAEAIRAPVDAAVARRSRPMLDRQALLDGLMDDGK
jgi:hypothetical protein